MTDPAFNQLIDKDERFGKGDTLDVQLRMKQKYDPALKTYINAASEVTKVYAHAPGDSQRGLFR